MCSRDGTFYEDYNITGFGKDERPQSVEDVLEDSSVVLPKPVVQVGPVDEIPAVDEEHAEEEEEVVARELVEPVVTRPGLSWFNLVNFLV